MASPSNHTRICTAALTAAMILVLSVSAFKVESRVMSEQDKAYAEMANRFWRAVRELGPAFTINHMDPLDPVHVREHINPHHEFDHDLDGGWEHAQADKDNGGFGFEPRTPDTWQPVAIAAAAVVASLPVVEAPGIVPEEPETQPTNTKAESDG